MSEADDNELEGQYRALAEERYANDDCEFDDNCAVSIAEDGAWVACWRWIPEGNLP